MGTDIHPRLEQYDEAYGKWHAVDTTLAPSYDHGDGDVEERLHQRSYAKFAIMNSDVRSYGGFVGLTRSRGIPADLAEDHKGYERDEGWLHGGIFGEHSFSWFTLDEVDRFDWTQRADDRGTEATYGEFAQGLLEFCSWAKTHTGAKPEHLRLVFGFDN